MKKTLSILSALVMLSALAVPFGVSAEEVHTIQPKGYAGSDTFNIDPDNNPVDAEVSLGIDPAYTVTIPAEFKLDTLEQDGTYSGSGTLTAESVFLNEGKIITVSLTSASGFNMKTAEAKEYQLPYTATGAFGAVAKPNGGKVAEFQTLTTKQTVTLTLATDKVPTYAGKYTDPVVFQIAVTESEN